MKFSIKRRLSARYATYLLSGGLFVILVLSITQIPFLPHISLTQDSLAIVILITILILSTYFGNLKFEYDFIMKLRKTDLDRLKEIIETKKVAILETSLSIQKSHDLATFPSQKKKLTEELESLIRELENFEDRV